MTKICPEFSFRFVGVNFILRKKSAKLQSHGVGFFVVVVILLGVFWFGLGFFFTFETVLRFWKES